LWLHLLDALEAGVWLFWVLPEEIVYVPVPKTAHRRGTPHCETGPALESLDLQLWYIDGVEVDEQIVMRPATQTVEQIEGDENQDRRAVRIARFGWPRYLKESGAECRDERANAIEGTREALYETSTDERRLVVTCPTGRLFALGVPNNTPTCEAAQHWLAGGKNFNVLART
jgi:hypothetical protein